MSQARKIALWLVGILLILAIGVGVYYFKFFNTPKRLFETSINTLYNNASKKLEKLNIINIQDNTLSLDTTINFSDSNKSVLGNYDYNFRLDYDKPNKKIYGEIAALKKNSKIISANLLANSQKAYVSIPETFNKVFDLGSTEEFWKMLDEIKTISGEDYSYLLTFVKNSLINSLKDSDFTTTKDANNKKTTLKLTKERQKEIVNSIIYNILNDQKAKTIMAKILDESEADLASYLNNAVKDAEFNDYEISIYTNWLTNNKIVQASIKENNQEIFNLKVNKDTYTIDLSSYSVDFFDESKVTKTTINIVIKKENNKYIITISSEGKEYATLTVNEYNDNKIDLDYVIKINETTETNNTITGKFTYAITKSEQNTNIKASLNVNYDKENYTLNVDTNLKNTVNIPNINTNNVTTFDDLTDEDLTQIQNNLTKNNFFIDIAAEYYKLANDLLYNAPQKANMLNPDL